VKEYISSLLDEFNRSFALLDKRHLEIMQAMTKTSRENKVPDPNVEKEILILEVYRDNIYGKFVDLKARNTATAPFINELSVFFTSCMAQSAQAVTELKDNRSTATAIFDFMKEVANFCKKYLYMILGREPQFFTTTTAPIESTQEAIDTINKSLKDFKSNLEKGSYFGLPNEVQHQSIYDDENEDPDADPFFRQY